MSKQRFTVPVAIHRFFVKDDSILLLRQFVSEPFILLKFSCSLIRIEYNY